MDRPEDTAQLREAHDREHGTAHPNNRGTITDHTGRNADAGAAAPAALPAPKPPPPPPPPIASTRQNPSFNVQRIRDMFTPEGMRRRSSSRAKSTFNKHQSENEKLGVYLWLDPEKRVYLTPDLRRELRDVDAKIDYAYVEYKHRRYSRNGGKKTLGERKADYRITLLRDVVRGFLGKPGTRPPRRAFDLDALSSNVDIFLQYIAEKVKADGSLMKPYVYKGFRSSLSYLFYRYNFKTPQSYDAVLSRYMTGAAMLAKDASQKGEGNDNGGAREMGWPLYLEINQWFMEDGSPECIFAAAFAKTILACRGDSTGQICTKQVAWAFVHEKAHQDGGNASKRHPRHCFSNTLNQASDYSSTLFHYLVMNPHILANSDGPLFEGSADAVSKAFSRALKKVATAHSAEIEEHHNIKVSEIHIDLYRKCARAGMNCGTTDDPSSAVACIREGYSLGAVGNVYIEQEKASDCYCGRILSRLSVNDARLAVSFPDFIPIDINASVTGRGVSEREFARKQKEVDEQVNSVLDSIFGKEMLARFKATHEFLRIGLASHIKHIAKIEEWLPANANIRQTPLFTNPLVAKLEEHVRIAMPWEGHYKYFFIGDNNRGVDGGKGRAMEDDHGTDGNSEDSRTEEDEQDIDGGCCVDGQIEPTGLPAHVSLLAEMGKIEKKLAKIERMLEGRQTKEPAPQAETRAEVGENERMKFIQDTLVSLSRMVKDGGLGTVQAVDSTKASVPRFDLFNHPDKIKRRVPPNWEFPKLNLQHMYLLWHCGDEDQRVAPIKLWDSTDVQSLKTKRIKTTLFEVRKVMRCIDNAATAAGAPPRRIMSHAEVITCFNVGKWISRINIPLETASGKRRCLERMPWTTIVKHMPKIRNASLAEKMSVVDENERMKYVQDTLLSLSRIVKDGGSATAQAEDSAEASVPRFDLFDHPDKIQRRVPPNWEFPKLNLQHMYLLWHCGNEDRRVAPIKLWDSIDVESLKTTRIKSTLSEVRRVMRCIDNAATAAGAPPRNIMSHAEVITCYNAGKSGINIPLETPSGRQRNLDRMSWTTIVKNMPKTRKDKRCTTTTTASEPVSDGPPLTDTADANFV